MNKQNKVIPKKKYQNTYTTRKHGHTEQTARPGMGSLGSGGRRGV